MQRMSLNYGLGITRMVEGQIKRIEQKTRNVLKIYRCMNPTATWIDYSNNELINLDHLLCQGQVCHIGSRK